MCDSKRREVSGRRFQFAKVTRILLTQPAEKVKKLRGSIIIVKSIYLMHNDDIRLRQIADISTPR